MKKILLIINLVFLINSPNVIYAQSFSCPSLINCNYEQGTCNSKVSGHYLDTSAASEPFLGNLQINLSKVIANKMYGGYQLTCEYRYGKDSFISMIMNRPMKNLIGPNWTFSGFGRQHAECLNSYVAEQCLAEE